MKVITITGLDVIQTIGIVKELRAQGLVQGKDFDFKYEKPKYNSETYEKTQDRHAEFKFYDDKYATLFGLRYGAR